VAAFGGVLVGDDLLGGRGLGLGLHLARLPEHVRAALGAGGSAVGGAERSDAHEWGL
jgi:hypothetical protein